MKRHITRIIAVVLCAVLLLSSCARWKKTTEVSAITDSFNTNYTYVFVHGLSGWGSYDTVNKFLPYWGTFGGNLMKYLNDEGFNCVSASVSPKGSAWDRACELYAQLTGTVVDYGKEHSERCNHERFGEDFSDKPLVESWSAEDKINLLGHSFGGATVRLLAELMANGSEAEINATDPDDISPFFTGGKADWIYSITALAAPHNGTSAYNSNNGETDIDDELSFTQRIMSDMVGGATAGKGDGRADYDYANYDLQIDNALELNKSITAISSVYYFSVPCSSTYQKEDGTYEPYIDMTETMFVKSSILMGRYTGTTEGGFVIDESWLDNDGLVNVISAKAPFDELSTDYDKNNVKTGIWNIMPVYKGDHMSLQGGMMKTNDIRDFYTAHLQMINEL